MSQRHSRHYQKIRQRNLEIHGRDYPRIRVHDELPISQQKERYVNAQKNADNIGSIRLNSH
jgi:hypothetical protein